MPSTLGWTLDDWRTAYRNGASPGVLLSALLARIPPDDPAWISVLDQDGLAEALGELGQILAQAGGDRSALPLYGIPVAVKDNIDAWGFDTTAGCPAYGYRPNQDAVTVAQLKAAGAVVVGKTNLDQFATGLVGTRSPFGVVPNSFNPEVISGGSSSGSAVAVAQGQVPLALGTDTAGSGRIPAGLNNVVGLKPTRGAFSIDGVVPACRSLDCVSLFTLTAGDAAEVYHLLAQYEPSDPYSRRAPPAFACDDPAIRRPGALHRLAIPANLPRDLDVETHQQWQHTLKQWQALGITLVPMDFTPLHDLAALLYEGPWVAERHATLERFLEHHSDAVNPVVREIIATARNFTATDSFRSLYRRDELVRQLDASLAEVDGLLVPTAPLAPRIADIQAEPVALNSRLGLYSNFVNLADFCALAVPAGFREDGLPFGVTLISGAWRDADLLALASRWLNAQPTPLGATGLPRPREPVLTPHPDTTITVAVVGAHLSGMPLNHQLTERRATLLGATTTAPRYRLYALADTVPAKPGLRRVANGQGETIVVELWEMAATAFGSFVDLIPPPLGLGNIELSDGRWVNGFICEGYALEQARDVTSYGSWRAYVTDSQQGQTGSTQEST